MRTDNEFGAFFREIRQGLGLSLREFCRRTGFDQANVSRLERGLLPPPKSQKVLTAYAKGLRLKPKTPEWERFMTLAKPPAQPRRGQHHKNWVTARHLEEWARTLEARSVLPQLVRRLIRATGQGLVRVRAPAGEQTQRPEWDGRVEASGAAEFVPQGLSVWEMGVEKEPKAKAEADFTKRQKRSLGVVRRTSTFVFVTPRKWQKKAAWAEEKTKLKSWREVRVYDSACLEEWLESAPAVDTWLARQLGLCPPGLIDVDEYWNDLRALTDPSLEAEVYLASRAKEFEQLKAWLEGPPDTLVIESRSPAEALDFVIAASRRQEVGESFAARAVIVETRDAWRSLAGSDSRLVLVLHPGLAIEAELTAEAVRNGHHVIVCASGPFPSQCRRINLPRVSGLELQKALVAQGVDHTRAAELARTSGGSIAVLKRRTARYPGTAHPEWSRMPNARTVVPLLLAGRWSDSSEGDRLALEKLADAPYRDVIALAERWAGAPEPMLRRVPSRWELVSRDDSWALVSHALSEEDLRRFEKVTLEVLAELDPACELPSDERWCANILGKVRRYSSALRTGLAESLALLGARPPEPKGGSLDPRGLATYLVRSLLDRKGSRAWASLSSELPLLAEAAPDPFLAALESDLAKRAPAVLNLFQSDSSPLFGPNLHTGLLFALEGLAWDRSLLPRVSRLLARLQEVASPTKLANGPMRTLVQIFTPWYPQTTTPVEERVRILQSVSRRHREAGWKLLLELLPAPHRLMVSTNYRPAFRNWALEWSEGATRADYAFQVEACADLAVELAGNAVSRLKDAVEVFENLPPSAQTELLDRISGIVPDTLKTDDRRTLAEALREKSNRHRRFAAADWALKNPVLEQFDTIRERLEPGDAVARNAWLFGDYWKVRWHFERGDEEVEDADKVVERLRAQAIDEVRSEKGWDGVLALASAAASPDQVGWAVGISGADGDDSRVLPQLLTDTSKQVTEFAKGYVRVRQTRQGWKWLDAVSVDRWSDDQVVEFALALPSETKAWDLVARRGPTAEEQYWKKVPQYCYSKNTAEVHRACSMFTRVGRAFDAVRQLAMARHRNVKLDPSAIVEVLQQGGAALANRDQPVVVGQVDYDIELLIQELQNMVEAGDARVDANTVASLEWTYLALLDGHPTNPKVLHKWLEDNPPFLIDLLKIVFRRSDEKEERPEPSESDRARALQVYRLLNSWQRVPGSRPDGSIDEDAIRRWIESVQALAEKESRREVADSRIGNVLASAPKEPDGTWPCIPVRDAMEEFGTEEMAEGFEVAIMNKRGATWKAPDEGGSQEREIAKQFFEWAEASRVEWPKTAASLRRVGERYEAYARREDAEAESR
jgi:transcriptional regulator with XRE-family HTH domain